MRKQHEGAAGCPRRLKRQTTIRLEEETVSYFKRLAGRMGIPYQTLINLYLRDAANSRRRVRIDWDAEAEPRRRKRVGTRR